MNRSQAGFSMVLVVMILLMLGLVMMTALNHQLSTQLRINRDEYLYIKAYNQAISSLNWGIRQRWPAPDENWYCQQQYQQQSQPQQLVNACIKQVSGSEWVVVKNGSDDESILTLYALALSEKIASDSAAGESYRLIKQPSGWLDFCPLGDNQC